LALLGNTIAANMFVVGYALQKGLLPVSVEAVERAIKMNGVAVEFNLRALELGRLWAHQPEALHPQLKQRDSEPEFEALVSIDSIVEHRMQLLRQYQNAAYANKYHSFVETVRELDTVIDGSELSIAVAKNLAKLMAYKDEYEVARLYSDASFRKKLNAQFEGDIKLSVNLAPPLISKKDPVTGHLRKREFGSWIFHAFKVLARLKGLRGSSLDVFGYSDERKMERQAIEDYRQTIKSLLPNLSPQNYQYAIQLADLPAQIRGFGHVKEANFELVAKQKSSLLAKFNKPPMQDKISSVELR
jgi:indolepyruvate ferredoxin oxidoreductase